MNLQPNSNYPNMCSTTAWYGSANKTFNLGLDTARYNIGLYKESCAQCEGSKKYNWKMDSEFYKYEQSGLNAPKSPIFQKGAGSFKEIGYSGDFVSDEIALTYLDWHRMTKTTQTYMIVTGARPVRHHL